MREFGIELLVSQGICFELRAPQSADDIHLNMEVRRQLFLIFKESIHNAARHSGCSRVQARLEVKEREIALAVEDDGRGLDAAGRPAGWTGGNGIPGMRQRAENLGGSIRFESQPGAGCTVFVRIPVRSNTFSRERP